MKSIKSERNIKRTSIYERKTYGHFQGSSFYRSTIHDNPANTDEYLVAHPKPLVNNYEAVERIKEEIYYKDTFIGTLPINLHELLPVIEKSKYILEFPDNWDGEGSQSYKLEVWKNAILLLIKYSTWVFKSQRKIIAIPSIYHAPNNSIDIYWETSTFNLLLNVSEKDYATYYGDDYAKDKIEGELDIFNTTFRFFPILL